MADPDGAVVVQGTIAVGGAAGARDDPGALVDEIERTRESLARTIDSLAERVSPANSARLLRARAQELTTRPEVRLAAAAVGFAMISFLVYRRFARRR
jgi:hypothetical protein